MPTDISFPFVSSFSPQDYFLLFLIIVSVITCLLIGLFMLFTIKNVRKYRILILRCFIVIGICLGTAQLITSSSRNPLPGSIGLMLFVWGFGLYVYLSYDFPRLIMRGFYFLQILLSKLFKGSE